MGALVSIEDYGELNKIFKIKPYKDRDITLNVTMRKNSNWKKCARFTRCDHSGEFFSDLTGLYTYCRVSIIAKAKKENFQNLYNDDTNKFVWDGEFDLSDDLKTNEWVELLPTSFIFPFYRKDRAFHEFRIDSGIRSNHAHYIIHIDNMNHDNVYRLCDGAERVVKKQFLKIYRKRKGLKGVKSYHKLWMNAKRRHKSYGLDVLGYSLTTLTNTINPIKMYCKNNNIQAFLKFDF